MMRRGAVRKTVLALVVGVLMTTLGFAPASAAPVSRDQAVNFVIARGLAQRGVPYVWGGGDINGPTVGAGDKSAGDKSAGVVGFDASGLIQYIYAGVGAKLPRSSGAMYNVGQRVTPAQALPADLIFYGPEGADSVAMFLGNSQMLEVTEGGVTVSPVRTNSMAPYLIRVIAGPN